MGVLALILPVSTATADDSSNEGGLENLIAKAPEGESQADTGTELSDANGKVTVMVELKDDPVAVVKAEKGGDLSADQEEKIESDLSGVQDKVAATIKAKGGVVESKMQSAINGMRVTIDSSELKNLESLPEVKAVHPVSTYERSNVRGVPMIGAPKAWEGTGGATGYTGEGVKVAVIDTGIDYTHATFGGPGTVDAFNEQSTASTPNPAWFGPNAPHVKGGVDLAGDDYTGTNTPNGDNNPIDCARAGHGTHVAGTVGGAGVLADGTTYGGAYNQKTYENKFKVGPGVAPKADLYAVRVFGCEGATNLITEAIDWAVKNKMDVINMSLGSPYGKRSDADSIASSNAVAAGVVVLSSAGNYGSQPYLTGSPAVGAGVISVAANDPTENRPGAQLTVDGKTVQAMNTNGAKLPTNAPVHVLKDAAGNASLGCADSDYANVPEGSIVITARGDCARVTRAILGQKHKAAAVVMINSAEDYADFEGTITGDPTTGEQLDVTIPFFSVKSSDGAALTASDGKQMTFAESTISNTKFTSYGDFSSAGPRSGDSGLRPSVVAPGVSIASARVGSGTEASVMSGTSMAAPHATGVAALTKQAHPSWDSQEISAAIVSTADASKVSDYGPTRGGGLVDPVDSTATQVFAYGDSTDVKDKTVRDAMLSFGYQESNGSFEGTKTITLVNKGNSEVTFNGEVKASNQSLPAQVKLNNTKVTVPAGGTAEVTVTMSLKASDVPSSIKTQKSQNFYEASGNVQFTSGDRTLSVPYLMVPRSTTKVTGEISSDSSKISFQNQGGAYEASGFLFDWGATDPKGDLPAGADPESSDGVDIANVGSLTTTLGGEKALVFAINSHTRHSNAAGNRYEIPIDNNNDGNPEYILFSTDSGKERSKNYNGVSEVFIYDTAKKTPAVAAGTYAVAPSDSSTVLLTVKASDVGVTGKFQYGAKTSSIRYGNLQDNIEGMVTYDPDNRPFNDGQVFQVPAGGSKDVSVSYNKAAADDQKSLGWMAVVLDNDQGTPEAVTGALTGGGTTPTATPTDPNPTVTPTDPNPTVTPTGPAPTDPAPTGSASPGDPSAPVSPIPTRAPLKPGLPKTGNPV